MSDKLSKYNLEPLDKYDLEDVTEDAPAVAQGPRTSIDPNSPTAPLPADKDPEGFLSKLKKQGELLVEDVKNIPQGLKQFATETVPGAAKEFVANPQESLASGVRRTADLLQVPKIAAGIEGVGGGVESLLEGGEFGQGFNTAAQQALKASATRTEEAKKAAPHSYDLGTVGVGVGGAARAGTALASQLASAAGLNVLQQYTDTGDVDVSQVGRSALLDAGMGLIPEAMSATGKAFTKAGEKVGQMSEGKAAQFVGNPELMKEAERAGPKVSNLKREFEAGTVDARDAIQTSIDDQKAALNQSYADLNRRLAADSKPVENVAESTAAQVAQRLRQLSKDDFLTTGDRALVQNVLNRTHVVREGKAIPFLNKKRKTVSGFAALDEGPTSRYADITEGENLALALDMRQRLADAIDWVDMPNAGKDERMSNQRLKQAYNELNDYIEKSAGTTGVNPETAQVLQDVNSRFATYIKARQDIEPVIGEKVLSGGRKQPVISENKVGALASSGSEAKQGAVQDALGALQAPEASSKLSGLQQNVAEQERLGRLGEDVGFLQSTPIVNLPINVNKGGLRIGAGSQAGVVKAYNLVDRAFKKPALTAAVRMIALASRPITVETLQSLARQHDVNMLELQEKLEEGGIPIKR